MCLHNDDRTLGRYMVDTTIMGAFVVGIVSVDSSCRS